MVLKRTSILAAGYSHMGILIGRGVKWEVTPSENKTIFSDPEGKYKLEYVVGDGWYGKGFDFLKEMPESARSGTARRVRTDRELMQCMALLYP